ncbi:MAG: hypothetical protein ACQCN4_06865 [Candidatus Bathyarchaeia archaeon]|jgi:hypothetical protein
MRKIGLPRLIIILVGSFFLLQLLQSQFSTLSIIFVSISVLLIIIAIILIVIKNKSAKVFSRLVVGFFIFVLAFGGAGFYMQAYAGPIAPTASYPEILDASLSSYLQTLESSPSFQFYQLEHFGTLIFESLSIHSTYSNAPQGGVNWAFYAGDIRTRLTVGHSSGHPYFYLVSSHYRDYDLPSGYPSHEQIINDFNQIDSLGLNWFFNQAVLEYQNATGKQPNVSTLNLDLAFDSVESYQGITLTLTARDVFVAEFQPKGTLLNLTTH